jgi:hypothetical protein
MPYFPSTSSVVSGVGGNQQMTFGGSVVGYRERPKLLKELAPCGLQALTLDPATPYYQEARTSDNGCKQDNPG